MTVTLDLILMLCAIVCFLLAAAGVASRVGLIPIGLALWALAVAF